HESRAGHIVGNADHRGIRHLAGVGQDRLEFRRPGPLARNLDRVIAAAEHVIEPRTIALGEVTMGPDARDGAPVALQVTRAVAPDALGHANAGIAQHHFADGVVRDWPPVRIDDVHTATQAAHRERTWPHRMDDGTDEVATAYLGAAHQVDDG